MVDFTKSDGFVTDDLGRRQYANRDDLALVEGTELDADDHNQVRNELVYLVAQAGLTPSNDDLTQVYQAVRKLVAAGESEVAVGFTPVEQGGNDGLTSDKINIGNSSNGFSAYISGNFWGIFASQDWANRKFQTAGDYATNPALQAETQRATTIESNLQSSKANLAGGNQFSGDQTVKGNVIVGMGAGWAGGTASGQGRWANGHLAFGAPDNTANTYTGYFQVIDYIGDAGNNASGINMFGFNYTGARFDWYFPWNGNIITPKGFVAFQSDLQNYQPAGSYVTTATYSSDFATADSSIINLPYGNRILAFTVTVDGNGSNSHRITYPQAFSGPSTAVFNCNDTGQSRSVSLANGTLPDSTGFNISVSVHGNSTGPSTDSLTLTVFAKGPK